MPANDHIHTGGIGGNSLIDLIARMRQNDDLIDAHRCQTVHLALHRVRRIREDDIQTRACQLIGILGREPDQTDFLTGLLNDHRLLDHIAQKGLTADIGIGH